MTDPRKYTALLADDVTALRNLIRIAVEGSGRFRVVGEAVTGREAIDQARTSRPDLVLLDLSMPEMDGLEALPHILEVSPASQVVVLSGFNHMRMAPVAKRMGAAAYLEKGVEPDGMVRSLLEVLGPGGGNGSRPTLPGGPPPSSPTLRSGAVSIPREVQGPTTLPSGASFRVLILESGDAQKTVSLLSSATFARFEAEVCRSLAGATNRLSAGGVDVVLVDPETLGSPPDDGLIEILTLAPRIPVVALLGSLDPDVGGRAIRLGVEDCLPRAGLDGGLLGRSLLYAIERRRASEARRQVREKDVEVRRLRRLEDLKTQFFNSAAHELGTPLTPIRLQLEILKRLQDGTESVAQRKAVEILDRNVDRLAKLSQDILDVARLQGGHMRIQFQPTDLHRVVREVVESLEPFALTQGIDFTVASNPHALVSADPRRIGQVLLNLVNNAIKFTPRGGRVVVECTGSGDAWRILVRDTGVGLRQDQIARLFQPFEQVLDEAQPAGVGTGLGLFVSRGIIELHGGRLWCESPGTGRGATFAFALPALSTASPQRTPPTPVVETTVS